MRHYFLLLSQYISIYPTMFYGNSWRKRLFDIIVAILLLLVLTPLFLIVVVLIYLDSPGSIFFTQTRIGKEGKFFTMWKFRSMVVGAEQLQQQLQNEMVGGVLFKVKHDPRITRVGRFIRKFSIDELPQLWNVIIGDMSMVGPRPALPNEVVHYNSYQRRRLTVNPGITCFWQITGRSEIDFHQQVELDLQYIATQSFTTDLLILLKTIPAVLMGRGAY
ncbi:MAG: sugar transferase [Thioploca sp.]|nr:sugar transferase [Thioploca sp.]